MILLFDLDGTILDTYALIRETFIELFKRFLPSYEYTEDDLRSFFGPSLYDTFKRIGCNEEKSKELFTEYRKINKTLQSKYLKLFPNTEWFLEDLKSKGYKMAIFSNKVHEAIMSGLIEKGIDKYFLYVLGVDEVDYPKPNPQGIEIVKNRFKDECIYIGDTKSDMLTAKNAGVLAIGTTQAGSKKGDLIDGGADYVIEKISDLPKLLEVLKIWYMIC